MINSLFHLNGEPSSVIRHRLQAALHLFADLYILLLDVVAVVDVFFDYSSRLRRSNIVIIIVEDDSRLGVIHWYDKICLETPRKNIEHEVWKYEVIKRRAALCAVEIVCAGQGTVLE